MLQSRQASRAMITRRKTTKKWNRRMDSASLFLRFTRGGYGHSYRSRFFRKLLAAFCPARSFARVAGKCSKQRGGKATPMDSLLSGSGCSAKNIRATGARNPSPTQ